jgi:conjugal transfer/type IV secretion protein DotA/TraY
VTWRYSLSVGNESGDPVCGSVTINTPPQNQTTIAGVNVNMAGVQQAVLQSVLTSDIRNQVNQVATGLYTSKSSAALASLQSIYTGAVNDYTKQLQTEATTEQSAINSAIQSKVTAARQGNLDLLTAQQADPLGTSETQQSALGWTSAGAYYLEIARMNAATLSLLTAGPDVTSPTYDGIGPSMSYDLAPLVSAASQYMQTLRTTARTTDNSAPPTGVPTTLASIENQQQGSSILEQIFNSMHITQALLNTIESFLLPSSQTWTDPFGGLMGLGQTLMNTALLAFVAAGLLASKAVTAGATIYQVLTFQWGGAAATVAGHTLVNFLAIPIFTLLTAILVPGIIISYVLPMIPYVLWMAGVCGWIILVC